MWTKEETDKLFDLCEQFDLRFIVVADRFPTSRTVEELKNRYYSGILHKYPATFASFFWEFKVPPCFCEMKDCILCVKFYKLR